MNRIDRLTAILVQLQGKSRVKIEELEERFEISRRTIFRDIKSLLESGVPIGGDAGDGYFIVEGYHLPPVVFNKQEAAAILIGSKLAEKNADSSINKAFNEGMHKIRAVLKYSDKDYLDTLDNRMEILGNPSFNSQGFPDSHIADIQIALATKKVVTLEYYANYNDANTTRNVEPLGLVFYSSRWHLIGYCRLRKEMRDFRTDRISKLTIINETFYPENHPDFRNFTSGMLGGTDVKKATIRVTKMASRFISEQKYYYGFIEEEKVDDNYIDMTFATPSYEFLARWLLSFGNAATVLEPSELQGIVATFSKDLFEHHKRYFEID